MSATSTNGRAVVQALGPASITTTGAITATSATAPFVSLSADIKNSNGDVVSQGNLAINGALTQDLPTVLGVTMLTAGVDPPVDALDRVLVAERGSEPESTP